MADRRLVGDWLAGYLELTAEQESPEQLHLWTGMCTISASVRRKIYLDMAYGRVFPNIYVIIVAESARVRKSAAMDIGRDLLIDAFPDIRVMRDSMTSQGLIKSLNHKVQVIKDDKITEELRSDVAIFADEVANLFSYDRTRAAQMVIFLTRAYGCPAIYDHTTVRDATVRLHNLYPVFLGGTDPHNLKVFPEDAIGGLTGRLIWIIEAQRRKNNPGWKEDHVKVKRLELLREYLIHDLQRIAHLQGEMHATHEAISFYDTWYEALSRRNAKDPETDAFYQRCHTTALRIAILLSLAHGDSLEINEKQMAGAVALIEQQLPEMKRVTMWSGSSIYEVHRAKFITYLFKAGGVVTRRMLLKHMGMPSDEFDKMTFTLIQDGSIEIPPLKVKGEIVIKLLKSDAAEQLGTPARD